MPYQKKKNSSLFEEEPRKKITFIFVCGEAQTMEQSMLLLLLGISALFRLSKSCVLCKTFKIKVADIGLISKCAKFQLSVTSTLAKKG